jgi:hypothetical protein
MRLPQQLQQLPPCAELHQQIYVLLVLKIPVERSHVAVRQVELDGQLSRYLVCVLLLTDLLL